MTLNVLDALEGITPEINIQIYNPVMTDGRLKVCDTAGAVGISSGRVH